MRNPVVFGLVAFELLFSGLGQAITHAATLAVSFPEVNGNSHTSGFPLPPVVVATDSFVVPAGQSVLSASFSGVFGSTSQYVGSTAQFDLLLNGVEFGSTFDVTPTPYTNVVPFDFNISSPFILSSLDGQSATLSVVQESIYRMYLSTTTLSMVTATVPTWAAAVSGSWSNAGNWIGGVPDAIGAGALINAPTATALTITVDAPQTLGTLLLGDSAAAGAGYTLTGTGTNTLTLNNSGSGATIVVPNGTHAVNVPIVLNDNLTISNNASLTLGGAIADGSNGPMGITLSGSGRLMLAGANTYSGNTTISGGTLTLANPLSLQNSTVNVTSGGALSFAAGVTSPSLGGLKGGVNIALATAASEPVMLSVGQNGQGTTYGGVLSGAGGLTKQGAGVLTLTASQGYKGPTVINGGVLKLQPPTFGPSIGIHFVGTGSSVTGSAGVVAMNNWINLRGENFNSTPLTDNSGASTTAQLTTANVASAWASGSSNQLLNGFIAGLPGSTVTVTLSGIPYSNYSVYAYLVDSTQGNDDAVAIGGKTYYYSPTNAATYTQVTNTNSASYPAGNYAVASGLTGSSQTLSVQGIRAAGTLAGFEIVNNTLNRGGILPAATPLSIAAGATLDLGGGSQQVSSLSDYAAGSGGSIINSGSTASVLTLSPSGGSTTFSGMIQGGGTLGTISLVMSGSGTQVLAGTNTYTGLTRINAGKLVVNGSLGNTAVTVGGGALLGGTGSIGGSVTVAGGSGPSTWGTISLVDGAAGTLTLSDAISTDTVLTLGGGGGGSLSMLDLEVGATADRILIAAGKVVVNPGGGTINITPLAGFGPGTYDLMDFASNQASGLGYLSLATTSVDGYPLSLQSTPTAEQLVVAVPEPSTLALLAASAAGLLTYGWRRRR